MAQDSVTADGGPEGLVNDPRVPEDSLRSIGFTALLLLTGILFIAQSGSIRSQAAIWPRGLAMLLIALTAIRLVLLGWRRWQAARADAEANGAAARAKLDKDTWRRLFTAGWLLAYCVAAQLVGFGPALLVFVPVCMWVLEFRRPLWIAAITVGTAVCLTLLFGSVAHVPIWDARL